MTSRVSPGVLASGGGSCSNGVLSFSGCVRSTTRTEPSASAAASWSMATKCLLQPFGADVRIDFGVQDERAVALGDPLAHGFEIRGAARGDAAAARRLRERGEVRRRELRE